MKKFLSILLMVLYTVSVSASVVSIHYCGNNIEHITIASFGKDACCCTGKMAMSMDMGTAQKSSSKSNSKKDTKSQKAASNKSCCANVVLQSRLAMDQLSPLDVKWVMDHAVVDALPVKVEHSNWTLYSNRLHQPMVADFKAPPPRLPLYILFQRFTYYG